MPASASHDAGTGATFPTAERPARFRIGPAFEPGMSERRLGPGWLDTRPRSLTMPKDDHRPPPPLSAMLSGLRLDELLAEVQQRLAEIGRASGRERCRSRWSPY